jgi:Ca-activated chloride channel family protein
MTFENHIWLTLTPLIVLLFAGLFVFGMRRREALLSRFAAARLLDQLTEQASKQRTVLKAFLILLALALIGISLARPQYGVDWIERKARGLDIVFVLDSSKSMLATDLRPTRLDRAKLAIIDLVKRLESDRIGLVVFAGNAFLQTPPTLDYAAFRENLDSIGHTSLSRGGSDIGRAIREAAKAFPKDNNFKVVVLLTDGEDQEAQAIETAREVAKDGIKIYTIGIGTPEGEYLKIRNAQGDEAFIRDANGQPVRSQLDEATLQQIAQLTNGSYSRLSDQSLNTLYRSVLATLPREERESELQEARIERYQWTLSIACIFLVLEIFIRRRSKASIHVALALTAATLCLPTHSEAQEVPEVIPETADSGDSIEVPLSTGDEDAPEAITHELPSDPRILYNQAHEQLTAGNYADATRLYEAAIELSENVVLERDALYNMAHAASQTGEAALQAQDFEAAIESWKQAEALFKSANEMDNTDKRSLEDAAAMEARRKALEDFLKQQEPPKDQENQDQQDQEQSEDEQEQEASEEQQSEDSEQGEENQDSEEQGEDEQSEQNDEQSGDEQEGDQGQDSEQGEDGEQPSEQEGSEGEESGEQENQESTGNPAEDMEQQAEQDNQQPATNNEQPATNNEQPATNNEQPATSTLEGMSVAEAQDLLDSLRGAERLLPFSEPTDETRTNRNSEIRDW